MPETNIQTRVKLWLEKDGEYVFGQGICTILKAVEETGSIKAAAASLEKSYRHVWSRIKTTEVTLGVVLVDSRVGGEGVQRSQLTDEASLLVEEYHVLRKEVFELVEKRFAQKLSDITRSVLET